MITSAIDVREITDEEVAFFRENGWVKLDGLLSRELAADLLSRAQERMGKTGDASQLRPGKDLIGHPSWHDYHDIADEDELFERVGYGRELGKVAQRLMRRDIGVRSYANMLAVKLGKLSAAKEYAPTYYHQDSPTLAMDRNGFLGFWIALDEVTPDMGSLRFHTGSHRMGSLGRWNDGELVDLFPNLKNECPLSPELHFMPGDVSVHDGNTVHGAPANTTDRPRWAFLINYFPADTRFTAAEVPGDEHIRDAQRYGLKVGETFDHPAFRLVYP